MKFVALMLVLTFCVATISPSAYAQASDAKARTSGVEVMAESAVPDGEITTIAEIFPDSVLAAWVVNALPGAEDENYTPTVGELAAVLICLIMLRLRLGLGWSI
jgi:hypothetical protein